MTRERRTTSDGRRTGEWGEIRKRGTAAAPGIAIGRAYVVDRRRLKTPKHHISDRDVEAEVERFRRALELSDEQLEQIKQKIHERDASEHYNIIAAHQLILHDEHLVDETIRYIREKKINAEWALKKTVEHIKGVFDAIEDDYFRERRSDVDFVGERVMRNLMGHSNAPVQPPPDAIVVAHDLSPADAIQLTRAAVAGLITDGGGKTSHTAIIARAHQIPCVVALDDVTSAVGNDDLIIVDGTRGMVILNPTPQTVAHYRSRARREAAIGEQLLENRALPAVTLDGQRVELLANVDFADEVPGALQFGATGVGLFRTEFLFMTEREPPSEDLHYQIAARVLDVLDGKPATFRTFDLGADKIAHILPETYAEANPHLGLRSIRLSLVESVYPLFKAQLRGLLRASAHGDLRIMFPMISGVDELMAALRALDEARGELLAEGAAFNPDVPVGVMIETPAAVLVADLIAPHVNFFSIGTNDLIQYTLAVDRVNERVAHLYEPLHPSILRAVRSVVQVALRHDVPCAVCGEMAGDPLIAPLLVGMGLRELSMNAVSIPTVKNVIRRIHAEDMARLVDAVLDLATTEEIRTAVRGALGRAVPGTDSEAP
ncbi:MAG: phosphoenolpyruvate--protein phosphotransferase [Deltaproteobacteria bacterium]|nr:MAG: phosphoenolpyruvate--protein phosphotransferase [Deltaproteobacteria bacterium]